VFQIYGFYGNFVMQASGKDFSDPNTAGTLSEQC